jgi:putative spermidine/putrescine transport system ATP-binding protein
MSDLDYLQIDGVAKRFRQMVVLDDIALSVGKGEFVSLLGPSGCGKTTLLRILAGLLGPDRGRVILDGRDLGRLPPHRRKVGVVFQNYALFPHLTVSENVAFGLRAHRAPKARIGPRVSELLAMVQLAALAGRPIAQLSGGQQQRVAIARALAVSPDLVLLDEPLSALDRKLRETMQVELRTLLRQLGMTAIFVTHDQEEALALSDRIAVMNTGRIEQLAEPQTIYDRPATPFVLDFVGQATVLHGEVEQQNAQNVLVRTQHGMIEAPGRFLRGSPVIVAVRPERITLGRPKADDWTGASLPLAARTFLGSRCLLHGAVQGEDRAIIELPADAVGNAAPGETVDLAWRVADTLRNRLARRPGNGLLRFAVRDSASRAAGRKPARTGRLDVERLRRVLRQRQCLASDRPHPAPGRHHHGDLLRDRLPRRVRPVLGARLAAIGPGGRAAASAVAECHRQGVWLDCAAPGRRAHQRDVAGNRADQ